MFLHFWTSNSCDTIERPRADMVKTPVSQPGPATLHTAPAIGVAIARRTMALVLVTGTAAIAFINFGTPTAGTTIPSPTPRSAVLPPSS